MKKWELKEDLACWRQRAEVAERRVVELDGRLGATQRLVAQQATEESYAALAEEWKAAYAKDPSPAVTRKLMGYRVGPVTAYRVPDPADTAKVVGWTVCPRCRVSPPLPPRRICDECETDVGTRRAWKVGDVLEGYEATADLSDGATLLHVNGLGQPYDDSILRTIGKSIPGPGTGNRGVWGMATYRIESLPTADRDAATVAAAERHGDEIAPPPRGTATAETVLSGHWPTEITTGSCYCGWKPSGGKSWVRHVADQLAAAGALETSPPIEVIRP
jgi:hypothetical protein